MLPLGLLVVSSLHDSSGGESALWLLVGALATWRVSHMVVGEAGPWFVFERLRIRFGVVHDADGSAIAWPSGSVLACVWCLSVWVGMIVLLVPWLVNVVFALSTVACLIQTWVGRHGAS